MNQSRPLFVINSLAPIRICDNGGWTDTWFSRRGKVFNIGVHPCAEVQAAIFKPGIIEAHVIINAENYHDRYAVDFETHWGKHPLLEASIEFMQFPKEFDYEITIYSEAPGGASTGTSAAVTVALLGALDYLTPGRMSSREIAQAAQRVETELLAQQSGIQDQICSALGGINYIEMGDYPNAEVTQIQVSDAIRWELERRLVLVYLGKSHYSSEIHEMVIQHLENSGPDCKQLEDLRLTAPMARDAIAAGDFKALGKSMIENTDAQKRLHPDLVSLQAQRVIEIAREFGASGWKVNGAGGDGGSLTILCGENSQSKRAMIREIEQDNPLNKNIPIHLSRKGLRVWKQALN